MKRTLYAFAAMILAGLALGYFYYENLSAIAILNSVFMISMVFIMLGALMLVTRGGFFDAITLSFRRMMKKGTKFGEMMDDVETMGLPSEAFEYSFTEPVLISGIIGFLVTVFLSFNI
jgi:hypothetical protein